MKGSKQILLIMGIISLIVLFIFTLFIMAQYAKHYEQNPTVQRTYFKFIISHN